MPPDDINSLRAAVDALIQKVDELSARPVDSDHDALERRVADLERRVDLILAAGPAAAAATIGTLRVQEKPQ